QGLVIPRDGWVVDGKEQSTPVKRAGDRLRSVAFRGRPKTKTEVKSMHSGKQSMSTYRSSLILISVLGTLARLGATGAMVRMFGNSTALQVGSAIIFTILWSIAIK